MLISLLRTHEIRLRTQQTAALFKIEKEKMEFSRQAAQFEMLLAKKKYEDAQI